VASVKVTTLAAVVAERRRCALAQAPTAAAVRFSASLEVEGVRLAPHLAAAPRSRVHLAAKQERPAPVSAEVGVARAATSAVAAVEQAARQLPVVEDRARRVAATLAAALVVQEHPEMAAAIP
jgi:hypothetical protein